VDGGFQNIDYKWEERRRQAELGLNRISEKGLNRQIEEATYNIKPQDYNEKGELKEEAVPADADIIEHNFPENNSGTK
jgi:hypothetical protein